MSNLFDKQEYTKQDYERMAHTSIKDWLSMHKTNTQKEIAHRLENRQTPEFIAEEMGIPISHIILLKK